MHETDVVHDILCCLVLWSYSMVCVTRVQDSLCYQHMTVMPATDCLAPEHAPLTTQCLYDPNNMSLLITPVTNKTAVTNFKNTELISCGTVHDRLHTGCAASIFVHSPHC